MFFLVSNEMGLFQWYQLRNERNSIKNEIDQLLYKETQINSEIKKLKNDEKYIKKIAQQKYHMVQKGEKVFRVINKQDTN